MFTKKNHKLSVFSLFLSLLSASGVCFLTYVYAMGSDDILSLRETAILGCTAAAVFLISCLISRKFSPSTILLFLVSAFLASAAVNYEYPELMRLPVQIPAENAITITEKDENASLSMTWAYWFRPRKLTGDPFFTDPDRDISFSQLKKTGDWQIVSDGEDPVLQAREKGSAVGISKRFRAQLAVLCLKAENGSVTVRISGQPETLTITPEMTVGQPYRVIMKNGLLPETAGNVVQILLWGGAFCFVILCGICLCSFAQKQPRHCLIYIGAFLIPCLIILLLCVFLKITPFGEKTFLINDMWGEYADYMAYFRSILSGENDLFYSFSKSLGDDLLSLLAFYVINPLNWLVCLFKPEDLPLAVTLLVVLRYGIAGLTASLYFVKRRNCGLSALFFSTCYALMSFHILNAENTNLRESALVLPLVFLGLEQLIEDGKITGYVFALAAAVFLNFYSGYQICVFAALYFLFCYLKTAAPGSFGKTLGRFLVSSLLAVGICAFLLIPVVLQLRNGPKTFDPSILKFGINMPWQGFFGKLLASAYDVEQFKAEGLPNLYIGLFCALLLPLYFLNRSISGRKRALTGGLLVCCTLIMQINPLNLALHGFNHPGWWPYRYSFIICFIMLTIAQESFAHRSGWKLSDFILTALLFTILLGLLYKSKYDWMTGNSLRLNAAFIILFFLIFLVGFYRNTRHTAAILAIVTLAELFLDASHILTINTAYERSNTVSDYTNYYAANKPVFDEIRNRDSGFYRVEKNHFRTANDPMLFGYNGITHYSSTLNRDVMNFLPRAGFRYYPYRFLYWEGSDVSMDSLLGIKYLVSETDAVGKPYSPLFTMGPYTVYEDPYALPLMFTASPAVFSADISREKGGFEFQDQIFSALTGEKTEIFKAAHFTGPEADRLSPQQAGEDICYAAEKEAEGALTWEISSKSDDILYAFFPAENIYPAELALNGEPFGRYFDNFAYHVLRLGSFGSGEKLSLQMSPMEEEICLSDSQFYHEDLNSLSRALSLLRQDETKLRKLSSSHLEGSFTASEEKALFFTIPYNSGWTIRIDGQKVPVTKVLGTFMAVSAPEGTHMVDMRYRPVGLIPGMIISVISLVTVVFLGKKRTV